MGATLVLSPTGPTTVQGTTPPPHRRGEKKEKKKKNYHPDN